MAHGEGIIGPPLDKTDQFIAQMGWTLDQAASELAELVHGGIPTMMPGFPQLTGQEIERLTVHLVSFSEVAAWEREFEATQGRPPTISDMLDRGWSMEFAARFGRQPTDADWAAHWALLHPTRPEP